MGKRSEDISPKKMYKWPINAWEDGQDKSLRPWLVWLYGWMPDWEPKGRQFDSQSGHMPGLRARSPLGGAWEATTHWCFSPSLSPSLPLSLKINKIFKKERKKGSRKVIFQEVIGAERLIWQGGILIFERLLIYISSSYQKNKYGTYKLIKMQWW